jgi:hypothetical protein
MRDLDVFTNHFCADRGHAAATAAAANKNYIE